MRHYLPDSPEAIARILALAILADGGLDVAELRVLQHKDVYRRFGIDEALFDGVIKDFCFDLAQYTDSHFASYVELDRATIGHLLGDIRQPELRLALLGVIVEIVNADGTLAPGEAVLVSEAMVAWGIELHREANEAGHRPPLRAKPFGRRSSDRRVGVRPMAA